MIVKEKYDEIEELTYEIKRDYLIYYFKSNIVNIILKVILLKKI